MAEQAERVRLLLVDDHRVVRMGLVNLFATARELVVVGEAGTVTGAIAEARRCQPDVVILDVRLPDGSGVEACREIRSERPETHVIMLTSYADDDAVVASVMAGASGYLLKQIEPERLIEAVEIVAKGGSLLDASATDTVLAHLRRLGTPEPGDPLTTNERKILPLIAEGKTNRQIAAELYLSEHTVKSYVSQILRKLNLSRRAEAAAFSARRRTAPPV